MQNHNPIRIVFTEGGKGGVGKTDIAVNLATWYKSQNIKLKLIDFDSENKAKSSLKGFLPETQKLNYQHTGDIDHFFDACASDTEVVLADFGAGAGEKTYSWFRRMYPISQQRNIRFTAIGVTSHDPESILSVLEWAAELQRRVDYLVVLNECKDGEVSFDYWHEDTSVRKFIDTFNPHVIRAESRVSEFQTELRNCGLTLEDVLEGRTKSPFFKSPIQQVRAEYYLTKLYEDFDSAAGILLPITLATAKQQQ